MSYSSKHAWQCNFSISATADVNVSAQGDFFPRERQALRSKQVVVPKMLSELRN